MSSIVTVITKLAMILGLIVVMCCISNTYKLFDKLHEKDRYKSWLAVDLLILAIVFIVLIIKIIF